MKIIIIMICKIVRVEKLMCQNFMRLTERIKSKKKKKTSVLRYSTSRKPVQCTRKLMKMRYKERTEFTSNPVLRNSPSTHYMSIK